MSQNHIAIIYLCLGMFLASVADTVSKYLVVRIPIFEMLFFFGLSGVIFTALYGAIKKGRAAFKSNHYKWHLLRGVSFVASGALNIFALTRLQLDQFYLFGFTNAFWIAIVGYLFFKDEIGWRRFIAIMIGFATIVYMLNPSLEIDLLGAGAMLLSALVQAFGFVPVRVMPQDESKVLFGLSRMGVTLVAAAPFAFTGFIAPTVLELILMLGVGALYSVIMVLFSVAYLKASSSAVVAPFNYSQMIWGVVFGYLIFGDMPTAEVIMGSAILMFTGIYIIRMERKS